MQETSTSAHRGAPRRSSRNGTVPIQDTAHAVLALPAYALLRSREANATTRAGRAYAAAATVRPRGRRSSNRYCAVDCRSRAAADRVGVWQGCRGQGADPHRAPGLGPALLRRGAVVGCCC